jgi:hypothetical protein
MRKPLMIVLGIATGIRGFLDTGALVTTVTTLEGDAMRAWTFLSAKGQCRKDHRGFTGSVGGCRRLRSLGSAKLVDIDAIRIYLRSLKTRVDLAILSFSTGL